MKSLFAPEVILTLVICLLYGPQSLPAAPVISAVSIDGLERTHKEVVLRELEQMPGTVLDTLALVRDTHRLKTLQLFSSITRDVVIDSSQNQARLVYHLKERFAFLPYPALSYDEEYGLIWGGVLLDQNFRGWGEELQLIFTTGGLEQVSVEYHRPWNFGMRMAMDVKFTRESYQNEHEDFRQGKMLSAIGLKSYYRGRDYWHVEPYWNEITSDDAEKTLSDGSTDRFVGSILGTGLNRYDLPHNPTRGYKVKLELDLTSPLTTNSPAFQSYDILCGATVPLMSRWRLAGGFRWIQRQGWVPVYYNKYTGGSWSVRAYPSGYHGGHNLMVASVESRFVLIQHLEITSRFDLAMNGVIFFDLGRSWQDGLFPPMEHLYSGPGIGLHFYMPIIRMARFEFGFNPERNEWSWSLSNELRY